MADRVVSFVFKGNIADLDTAIESIKSKLTATEAASVKLSTSLGKDGKNITKVFVETDKAVKTLSDDIKSLKVNLVDALNNPSTDTGIRSVRSFSEAVKSSNKVIQEETAKTTQTLKQQSQAVAETNDARVASMKRSDQQAVDSARDYAATINGIKQRQATETLRIYQDLERNLRSIEERVASGSITQRTGTIRSNKLISGAELQSQTIQNNSAQYQAELAQYQAHQSNMLHALQQRVALEATTIQNGANSIQVARQAQAQQEINIMRNLQAQMASINSAIASGHTNATSGQASLAQSMAAAEQAITASRNATQAHVEQLQRAADAANGANNAHRNLLTTVFEFVGAYRLINFAMNTFLQGLRSIPQAGIEMQSTISALHASFSFNPTTEKNDSARGETLTQINMKMLREESDRAGISITTLEKNYRTFLASATLAGESTSTVNKIFKDLNTTITALHMSGDRAELTFLAIAQMFNKSKVQSEELVKQLGNLLPGAFAAFATATHRTTSELVRDMKAGAVAAHQNIADFISFYAERYMDAFGKASQGLNANLNRLDTAWTNFSRSIFIVTQDSMNNIVKLAESTLKFLTPTEEGFGKLGRAIETVSYMLGAAGLLTAIYNAEKAWTFLNVTFAASPIGRLILVFGGLTAAVVALREEAIKTGADFDKLSDAGKIANLDKQIAELAKPKTSIVNGKFYTQESAISAEQNDKLNAALTLRAEITKRVTDAQGDLNKETIDFDNIIKNQHAVELYAFPALTKFQDAIEKLKASNIAFDSPTGIAYIARANEELSNSFKKQEDNANKVNSKLEEQKRHYEDLVRSAEDLLREENDRVTLLNASLSTSPDNTLTALGEKRLAIATEYKTVLDQINLLKGVSVQQDNISVSKMDLLTEKSAAVKANLSAIATHPAIVEQIRTGAIAKGLDPNLAIALAATESKLDSNAKAKSSSASGIFQLINGTATSVGVKNVFDAAQNIEGGLKYMAYVKDQVVTANDNVTEAMQKLVNAYHDGPGFKGAPHSAEGIAEVKTVLSTYAAMGGEVDKTVVSMANAGNAYILNGNKMEVLIDKAKKLKKSLEDTNAQIAASAENAINGSKYTLPEVFTNSKASTKLDANSLINENGFKAIPQLESFLASAKAQAQLLTDELNKLDTRVKDSDIKIKSGLYSSAQELATLVEQQKQDNIAIKEKDAALKELANSYSGVSEAVNKWNNERSKLQNFDPALAQEIKALDSQIRKASLGDKGQYLDNIADKLKAENTELYKRTGIIRDLEYQLSTLAVKYDQLREAIIQKELFDSLKTNFASAITDMVKGTKSFTDIFKNLFDSAIDSILNSSIKRLQLGLENIWNGYSSGWGQVTSSLIGIGVSAIGSLLNKSNDKAPVNAAIQTGKTFGSANFYRADTGARDINYNAMIEPIRQWNAAIDNATSLIRENSESITQFLDRTSATIFGDTISNYFKPLIDKIEAPFTQVYSYVSKFGENLLNSGKQLFQNVTNSITGSILDSATNAGFNALLGSSVAGSWSAGIGGLSTSTGAIATTSWNAGTNLASLGTSSFAGSVQAAEAASTAMTAATSAASTVVTYIPYVGMFLAVLKSGFEIAKIAANDYLSTLGKISASLKATGVYAFQLTAGLLQMADGDTLGGGVYAIFGQLGELIVNAFKESPSFTLLSYPKFNQESQYDPSGKFFSSGGAHQSASIGVETAFGYLDTRVNAVSGITADKVKDSFLPLLETTKSFDAALANSIKHVDSLNGQNTLSKFLSKAKQYEPEYGLDNLDSSRSITDRLINYIGKGLSDTGTLAGVTAGTWIKAFSTKILDTSKGENYNLTQVFNIEDFISNTLPYLSKLPTTLAKLFTDSVKSISSGATQEEFIKQFTDFFQGWTIAEQGLAALGTDIKNTVIPEYLASLVGLGFTVKDAGIQLVQYAEAFHEAGGYTNDTLNAVITDLLNTAKSKGYSKEQVGAYTSTTLTLSKTAQELGFKDSANSAKLLTEKLFGLTTSATESANAEIDRIIVDQKLTAITRQAAIEQLILTGKLDETKVTSADFSSELVKQTKVYMDAIGTIAHFGQILGITIGSGSNFASFAEASKELITLLGGLDTATSRLNSTIKEAMGNTKFLYQEMSVSQSNANNIFKRYGVTEETVDSTYLMALASRDLTAAQKSEIVAAYEIVQASRAATDAYEREVQPLKELLTQYGLTKIAGTTLNDSLISLSSSFGSAADAANILKSAIDFSFSGNDKLQISKDVAASNFNTAATNAGLNGLTLETLRAMNTWALQKISDPNSGITTNTKVNYNGVEITPAQLFEFVNRYGTPVQNTTNAFNSTSKENSITPAQAYNSGSNISDQLKINPSYDPKEVNKAAEDATKKAEENAKKFSEIMQSINNDLKNFNIAPIQKSFNDLQDKIDGYIKSANETGNSIDAVTLKGYKNSGIKQIVNDWAKPLEESFAKLGKSDDYASVIDITSKYSELNKQLDIIYANTNRQYFTEKNLADARINLAKLQQAEIDKIKKATQDSINSFTNNIVGATRGSQVSSVLDILKEFNKQVNDNNSSGSLSQAEKDVNLNNIIYAAQLKVQDVFKTDALEFINLGKVKSEVATNEINTWFINTKSVLREIALAYNITEKNALEIITTIRDVRLNALAKERESTVLTALNSYKPKGDSKFPELQQFKNSLTDLVTGATTGIVTLLNAGSKYSDIILYLSNTYRNGAEILQSSIDSIQSAFDSFNKDVVSRKNLISDKIVELLNPDNTTIIYDIQRKRLLSELTSKDLQIQMSAAEALFNLETQRYQTAITNEKSLLDASKNIKKWIDDFKLSQLSTISPEAKVAEARKQYSDTLNKAKSGDVTALGEITGKANSLLEALNAYYASGTPYQTSVTEVLAEMEKLALPASKLSAGETIISQNTKDIVTNLESLSVEYDKLVRQQTTQVTSKIADLEQAAIHIETTFRASMEKLASVYGVSTKQLEDAVTQAINSPQQDLLSRTLTSILSGLSIFDSLKVTLDDVNLSITNLAKSLKTSTTSSSQGATSSTTSPTINWQNPTSARNPDTDPDINLQYFWNLVNSGAWNQAADYAIRQRGFTKSNVANWISSGGGSYSGTMDWLTMQGYANGGNYSANTAAIVGEKGPELFLSKVGGRVSTNTDSSNLLKEGNKEVVEAIKESIAVISYELRTLRSENADKQSAMVNKLAMLERRLSQIEGNGTLLGVSS